MIPAPNVLAGILVGAINESWVAVLGAAAVWPFVFCLYVSIMDQGRRQATVAAIAERGRHMLLGSPALTFYGVEFATALCTALPVAILAHAVKRLLP